MARPTSTGPSQLTSPNASHLHDDEIIMAQIQATLNSSVEPAHPSSSSKQKKRKSHQADAKSEDRDGNAGKKKRARDMKRASQALGPLQDVDTSMIDTSMIDTSENEDSNYMELTSDTQFVKPPTHPRFESITMPPGSVRCPDKASALMQSILKDCTPERVNQRQLKSFTSAILKTEETAPRTPSASEATWVGLTGKPSQKVPKISFPVGYVPGPQGVKGRFQCPVDGCSKKYTRRHTILEHLNASHGDQKLIDNENGTMTVVLPNQTAHGGGSIVDLSTSHSIVKREFEDRAGLPLKETTRKPKISSAMIRSINASKVVPSPQAIRQSRGYQPDPSSDEDDTLVSKELPLASVNPADPEPKIKQDQLVNSSNGTEPDRTKELYLHGAETVMDSWEVKPGVIRASRRLGGEGFEVEQNIAFSSAHIDSESNGIQFPGIEFQLCRLSAGRNRVWASDTHRGRICSVASGKVQVSVGKKEFSIGAHGMWRIPPGVSCIATNRCYAEAVLHVSTIKER